MSSLVMPSGFVDMSETEMEYNDGGNLLADISVGLLIVGQLVVGNAVFVLSCGIQTPVVTGLIYGGMGAQVLGFVGCCATGQFGHGE